MKTHLVGSQNKLLTRKRRRDRLLIRAIETNDEHMAMALSVHVSFQKPGRGVNLMTFDTWGPFLEKPGNLSGPKSNSLNYVPLAVKSCSFNMFQIQGKAK